MLRETFKSLAVGGLLVGALLLPGCSRNGAGDRIMDPPVIRTNAEAADYLTKAENLSKDILQKVANGDAITDPEKDTLREAANIFKGVRAYDPSKFGSYFAEGKIRYAMGEYQPAYDLLQQSIVLAPPPSPKPPLEVIQAVAEAHYVSSRCLFFLKRYAEAIEAASLAMALAPNSADYMVAKASALIELKIEDPQLRKNDEDMAKVLIVKAIGIDAEHKDALRLAKFLKMR